MNKEYISKGNTTVVNRESIVEEVILCEKQENEAPSITKIGMANFSAGGRGVSFELEVWVIFYTVNE